jgi:hypothetical protein
MENTNETTIKIDDYITITIKIPQQLDASEFFSLLQHAKTIANIKPTETKQQTTKKTTTYKLVKWDEKKDNYIKTHWNKNKLMKANCEEIGKALNLPPRRIETRYYKKLRGEMN